MNIYHDMMILEQIQKKNEKTKEVINLSQNKMNVIEDSQKYMFNLLSDLETDLTKMLAVTRNDLLPIYDDQDFQMNHNIKLSGASGETRLF
jgi:hypothetical protein